MEGEGTWVYNIILHRKQYFKFSLNLKMFFLFQSLSSDCELFSVSLCDIVCSFISISIGANSFFSSSLNAYSISIV
jgi:hypothetical protein